MLFRKTNKFAGSVILSTIIFILPALAKTDENWLHDLVINNTV